MTEPAIDVVHVGSACRDLTEDDPRGWRLGGGASYAALTTARLGLRTVAVVGVDAAAASADELGLLRDAGVELLLVPLAEGPVFHNRETPDGRVQHWPFRGHTIPIPEVPPSWRAARTWSLVPVAEELGDPWAAVLPEGAFISLAWQGLLREQGPEGLTQQISPTRSALLEAADLIGVSRHDLPPGIPLAEVIDILRAGVQLAVTDGHDGGRLIGILDDGRTEELTWDAVQPRQIVDPTGAGDVFLAALVAAIARPDLTLAGGRQRPGADLEFAAAAASFVVEAPGLVGVPDRSAVLDRLGRT